MFSCMIDAKDDRYVATADITGYFLQTYDTIGSINLKLDGTMSELLARIDPDIYRNYIITDDKGHKIMYAECLKSLYGTLDAALLFWLKLSTNIERWGFKMSRYDWYVMNKDI